MKLPHAILFATLLLAACEKYEYSETLTEQATVDDVVFAPSQHGSSSGIAIDGNGRAGPTFSSVSIPEKYAIVFRCQHGKFVVQGEGEKYRLLWERLHRGQCVDVTYREEYVVREDGRVLTGYDFLDACESGKPTNP